MSHDLNTVFGEHASVVNSDEFRSVDRALGALLHRMDTKAPPELALAAAVLSRARGRGDVCLPFGPKEFQSQLTRDHGAPLPLPAREDWLKVLNNSPLVGKPDDFQPLILDDAHRLYLHRLHHFETGLAETLRARAAEPPDALDAADFKSNLPAFFPGSQPSKDGLHRQYLAAYVGLTRRLSIITGGPGTGKTYVAGRLLTLGIKLDVIDPLRIALAAPTGKAAARLQEQIRNALADAEKSQLLPKPLDAAELPEARTLHRLLGACADGSRFRFDENNLLPYDVVLVDEASMIDLTMMARLFHACRSDARIILLGDPDQLASVEAGSVLADICGNAHDLPATPEYTAAAAAATGQPIQSVKETNPLGDCVVRLDFSHRAANSQDILTLAAHINDGNAAAAIQWMDQPENTHLARETLPAANQLTDRLLTPVRDVFQQVTQADSPEQALTEWNAFRILCAMRRGPFGAPRINQQLEQALLESGDRKPGQWYHGRPVIITRNNYPTRLFNGDLGIVWQDKTGLAVYFINPTGELMQFAPGRLPEHETAFALTIHKSQGSEFDRVLVVLPSQSAPVLTRELVYTGITRAKNEVTLMAPPEVLTDAIEAKTTRASGLRDALWS
ncbi:MAG: exodeoxyribonuclease V subunit alpha [Verrucomicrobia subdivision 3 bacterium]|nr:exodeoxyribonuclease V subunit alpha [Limisphaerales bacterium]